VGHRLSRIYTRTGDDGTTGLGDGSRTGKDGPRVEAIGAVDELNSVLGVLLAEELPADIQPLLTDLQHELFEIGGELSIPGRAIVQPSHVERIEKHLDRYNESLPALKEFILPGGSRAAGLAHLARSVCRRAERRLVSLSARENVNKETLRYLNRLSDLLFVLARSINRSADRPDVLWQPGKNG
jgi:cob(I)alamin adenosyltransferase